MLALVEGRRANGEGHAIVLRVNAVLRGRERSAKLAHGRDALRVNAHKRTSGESAVQLALCRRHDAGSISARRDKAQDAVSGLDRLVRRRDEPRAGVEHQRRAFRVEVGVRVADVVQRGPDVAERNGSVIGAVSGEENGGHSGMSFQDIGRAREHARGIAAALGAVAVLQCVIHVSNIAWKIGPVSGIIVPDW